MEACAASRLAKGDAKMRSALLLVLVGAGVGVGVGVVLAAVACNEQQG
jgi:hypothetical protein